MSDTTETDTTLAIGRKKLAPDHPARFSYLTVEEPKLPKDPKPGDEPKFSVQIIIPKSSPDVPRIHAAMKAAAKSSKATASADYDTLDLILRDGDNPKENKKKLEHLKGCYFFNASCQAAYPPDVIDRVKGSDGKFVRLVELVKDPKNPDAKIRRIIRGADGKPVIKSGDFGAVTVNFFGYSNKGNIGIAAGLRNIQKRKDGESLAGMSNADNEFDEDDDGDDDFMK